MIDMDPPRHDELRGLIARRFTPRAVQVWEEAVREVTDRVLDRGAGAGGVRLRRARSRPRSRCRCSPRSSASRRRTGATSSSSATGCSATRIPSTTCRPDAVAPAAAVLEPGGDRDVRVRAQDGRGAAQAPGQRHRHPARLRAAHPARVRRLLRPARHGRQRDDAAHDHARAARAAASTRTSSSGCAATRSCSSPRPRRCCAGRRRSTTSAARRRARRELAGATIPAGAKVTTWFVSGNRDETVVRGPGHVRRRPHAEQAHGVRPRRRSTTAWARTSRGWR